MSGPPTHGGGSQSARPTTNGSSAGAMPMPQQRSNDSSVSVSNGPQSGGMSQQNLNGIVRLSLRLLGAWCFHMSEFVESTLALRSSLLSIPYILQHLSRQASKLLCLQLLWLLPAQTGLSLQLRFLLLVLPIISTLLKSTNAL